MIERMDEEQIGNVHYQLRQETESSIQDIDQLKKSVEYLTTDFNYHRSLSNETKMSIDVFTERISELEYLFKQITDPLMKFACRGHGTNTSSFNAPSSISNDQETQDCDKSTSMKTVFISNLNEFICEPIISEYLRQNGIFVLNCKQVPGFNERSRNFKVMIKECDVSIILNPNLWPKGITTSIRDPRSKEYKEAVYGNRELDLPGIVITPGMSYWHDV